MTHTRALLVALALAAAAGCGDNETPPADTVGTLEITTTTTGEPGIDYSVIVDGASPRGIAANATLTIVDVETGTHLVQLSVPDNCSLQSDNPQTVQVTTGATTAVAFAVTCGA
jgi:predicted small lipoprotein YifL